MPTRNASDIQALTLQFVGDILVLNQGAGSTFMLTPEQQITLLKVLQARHK